MLFSLGTWYIANMDAILAQGGGVYVVSEHLAERKPYDTAGKQKVCGELFLHALQAQKLDRTIQGIASTHGHCSPDLVLRFLRCHFPKRSLQREPVNGLVVPTCRFHSTRAHRISVQHDGHREIRQVFSPSQYLRNLRVRPLNRARRVPLRIAPTCQRANSSFGQDCHH